MAASRVLHPSPARGSLRLTVLLSAAALLTWTATASAQAIVGSLWETNGAVLAQVVSGGTLFIGGRFSYVGPHTGSGVPVVATSGAVPGSFPRVEGGAVNAVAADGAGGWYIAGDFTQVGGLARSRLAHILADGSVAAWDPGADGPVSVLAISGSTVYVGGTFTSVGGQARNRLGALDLATGLATAWDPNVLDTVYSLAVSGSTVYVGGSFASVGGTRYWIAALDATTGQASGWDPDVDGAVYALVVSGGVVYAGGEFANAGGQARSGIAAIDSVTGLATAWNPSASGNRPYVYALQISDGRIYAGGGFKTIGGQTRSGIAALDLVTGLATSWVPIRSGYSDEIRALAVAGNAVYVGGDIQFTLPNYPNNCAAIDATTGQALAWKPLVNGTVRAVAAAGNTVFVGGALTSVGGQQRIYLAALDLGTGELKAWNPAMEYYPGGAIKTVVASGNVVYAGGLFFLGPIVNGNYTHRGLIAIDATTGQIFPWNPKPGGNLESPVYSLALSGNTLYVGGAFMRMAGQSRITLGAWDVSTWQLLPWSPQIDQFNDIAAISAIVVSGNTVYLGGGFARGTWGTPSYRERLMAVDGTTGGLLPFVSNVDGDVFALALSGNTLYVGGEFGAIGDGPQLRSGIAAVDATTGAIAPWDPSADGGSSGSPYVYALAVAENTVYAGGSFDGIGGQTRKGLAALDRCTGRATDWNPNVVFDYSSGWPGVQTLVQSGTTLYVGGGFTGICGQSHSYLAALMGDAPVPVEIALASAVAKPDRVSLVWHAAGAITATVYRRTLASDWQGIGSISSDGTGALAYVDRDVMAGTRYGYQLGIGAAGAQEYAGETWVDVPRVATLALAGLRPNPARRDLSVAFTLPDASPAKIEVLDIAGRIVLAREVGTFGAGSHTLHLSAGRSFAPGVYVLRLTQGGRTLTTRGAVIR